MSVKALICPVFQQTMISFPFHIHIDVTKISSFHLRASYCTYIYCVPLHSISWEYCWHLRLYFSKKEIVKSEKCTHILHVAFSIVNCDTDSVKKKERKFINKRRNIQDCSKTVNAYARAEFFIKWIGLRLRRWRANRADQFTHLVPWYSVKFGVFLFSTMYFCAIIYFYFSILLTNR